MSVHFGWTWFSLDQAPEVATDVSLVLALADEKRESPGENFVGDVFVAPTGSPGVEVFEEKRWGSAEGEVFDLLSRVFKPSSNDVGVGTPSIEQGGT